METIKVTLRKNLTALRSVNVEPAALLLMSGVLINHLVSQDVIMDKVCRVNLNYSSETCSQIRSHPENFTEEESNIQQISAKLRLYRSVIDHSFPVLFVIFMGPWTDMFGRKLPMLLSLTGYIFQASGLLLCTVFDSWDAYAVNFISAGSKALFGGNAVFSMAAFSYISDISNHDMRTVRTGLLSAALNMGVPIGLGLGGSFGSFGLTWTASFGIALGLFMVAGLILIFKVKDTKCEKTAEKMAGKTFLQKVFYVSNPKENIGQILQTAVKPRENSGRLKILVLVIGYVCISAPIHGEFGVMYMFLRKRLGWDLTDYSYFSVYMWTCQIIGSIMAMGVLSHALKLSDPLLGILSSISQIASCFIYAFAYNYAMMMIGPAVDILTGTMSIVVRSMLSKTVSSEEFGRIFSLLAILDNLVPLAMDPTYSSLYMVTLNDFAGAFFFLSAAVTFPPFLIFGWFLIRRKSEKKSIWRRSSVDNENVVVAQVSNNPSAAGQQDDEHTVSTVTLHSTLSLSPSTK